MVCEVDDCLFVGCSLVVYFQFIVIGECVDDSDVKVTGEALFAIGREIVEFQCLFINEFRIPDTCMITCGTAVKVVRTIVGYSTKRRRVN